jgi:hypothetical protein
MAPIRRSGEITLFAKREFDGFQTRLRTTTPFLVFELEDCLAMPEFRANFVILTKSETEKHTPHDLKEIQISVTAAHHDFPTRTTSTLRFIVSHCG